MNDEAPEPPTEPPADLELLRCQLHVFYEAHAPEKLEQLDKIVTLYSDDPATLWAQLFEKYATTPDEQARIRAEGEARARRAPLTNEAQDYAARYDRLVAGDS